MLLAAACILAAPATAHAWKVDVTVHGAGGLDETTARNLLNCEVSPSGKSESSTTICTGGSVSGLYAHGDIVDINAYVPMTAFNRGWRFLKWVDGTATDQINCDPQDTVGDQTSPTNCRFQIFGNRWVDVYFDDTFANAVDSLSAGPTSPTNATSASFNFDASGDPDSDFQCRLDKPAADADLDWYSCGSPVDKSESYSGLTTNGSYTFSVRSVDPSGNIGAGMSRTWTVDTVAPTVSVTGGPANGSTTNSTTAGFSLGASETSTIQCKLDRPGTPGVFAACASGVNSYTGLTADGSYTFSARAVDTAGNTGPTSTRSWTVDRTPPDSSISSGPSGATNSTSASFAFSATGGAVSYQCRLSPIEDWGPCNTGQSYSSLAPGTYTFSVRGIDAVGNVEDSPATSTFTVDTQAPDTSIDSGPSGETSSNSASFTFSATEPGVTFLCRLDAGPWESCTSGKTYSSLANGTHTFAVRGTDAAGNPESEGSAATRTWTISVPTGTGTGSGTGTGTGTGIGSTPDTTKPVAVLTVAKQRLARVLKRGFGSTASTTEAGTLVLEVLYRGKKVATAKRTATTAGSFKLVAKFTRKGKQTLGRLRTARLALVLRATDAAGNVTVKKKTVKLVR